MSVEEQPVVWLERWRVIQTDLGTRHFAGFSVEDQDSRVSTPILSFNGADRTGVTASGRRYVLVGPSGFDDDAEYVWNWYSSVLEVKEAADVSDEYAVPAGGLEGRGD
jgi:hypothetical protein